MAAADEGLDTLAGGSGDGSTLRLVWPQWQGAGTSSVRSLAAEFPFDVARRGYAVGSAVLEAVLPSHDGPTAAVPVETGDVGLEKLDGIEAKRAVVDQLSRALEIIRKHNPTRIVTLGGECSVSGAPFRSWPPITAMIWRSCGSIPIPTSVPQRANIRAITRWRSRR
jgi:hypothetical protein